ncbi:MAG: hypothetical protein DLM50_07545 [Candidatus Meridianibacter frigidus]|nr:MAG: hypothetical protein DLM50_07545 [Candidatus Eremiobacteraeota bacterium]
MLVCAMLWALGGPALADQQYSVSGTDRYRIGSSSDLQTQISYSGTETLTIKKARNSTRYVAFARITKTDQGGAQAMHASFEATLLPNGEQRDDYNRDPSYLTVLNQPFSVQLDAATLGDLSRLHGRLPFGFPAPMTGGALHGFLTGGPIGTVGGRRAISVRFNADGPMHGPLPDRPTMSLRGTMHMTGVAYYELDNALLLALDATLTISGNVNDVKKATAVSIVYKRSIRAQALSTLKEARFTR